MCRLALFFIILKYYATIERSVGSEELISLELPSRGLSEISCFNIFNLLYCSRYVNEPRTVTQLFDIVTASCLSGNVEQST
jgi:hypothetical protein